MKLRYIILALVVSFGLTASPSFGSVLTIEPRLSVSSDYTDNASLEDDNTESDFTTTISPSVTAAFEQKHLGFDFFYDYEHEFYDDETQNDSSRHNAGLEGWAEISKHTRITLGQRFQRVEDPLREEDRILLPDEDPYLNRDTTVRRSRETYYTFNSYIDMAHQFGEKDNIAFSYAYSLREDADEDGNSNTEHTPGVAMTYWFTPQIGIDTNFNYTRGEYDQDDDFDDLQGNLRLNRKITKHFDVYVSYGHTWRDFEGDGLDVESDYETYSPAVGFSYKVDKNTSLSLGVGYFYQDKEDDEDEDGPYADVLLTKNWTFPRGGFNLSGSSGIDRNESGAENRGFERYYGLIGRLTYGFTRHLNSIFGVSYRRNEFLNTDNDQIDDRFIFNAGLNYQPKRWMTLFTNYTHSLLYEDTKDPEDISGLEDEDRNFDVGITVSPKRWVSISLRYEYSRLDTELADEDNEENRVSLTVSLVPVRPYRHVY